YLEIDSLQCLNGKFPAREKAPLDKLLADIAHTQQRPFHYTRSRVMRLNVHSSQILFGKNETADVGVIQRTKFIECPAGTDLTLLNDGNALSQTGKHTGIVGDKHHAEIQLTLESLQKFKDFSLSNR